MRYAIIFCLLLVAVSARAAPPTLLDPWRVLPSETPPSVLPGDTEPAFRGCDDTSAPEALELRRAIEIAICKNPQARQAWASVWAQAAASGQARAGYLPSASASLAFNRDVLQSSSTDPAGATTRTTVDAFSRNLILSQLLFDFGARRSSVTQAERTLAAALASHDAALQTVFANVTQAYFDVLAADAAYLAAEDSEQALREIERAAQTRERIGTANRVEVLQAATAVAQAVLNRVRAQGTARVALGTLSALLGMRARQQIRLAPGSRLDIAGALSAAQSRTLVETLEQSVIEAIDNHPGVRAARAQLAAAQARRDAVSAEGLPSVSVGVNRYVNGRPGTPLTPAHTQETLTSLTVTVPLFEGFSRTYKVHEAAAQVAGRSAELEQVLVQTDLEAWRSYQTFQSETASLHASAELLRSGEHAFEAVQARYRSGVADIVEILNAQRGLAVARHERIRTLSAWHAARLKLFASLGKLGFWAIEDK